ncbi:MAG: hypothetical protein ABJQ90_12175, partial [Parasphingorhabdus sp.]
MIYQASTLNQDDSEPMVRLTASVGLVETDGHVAPASGRRVADARSVTGTVSMAVEVCVRLALCN